MVIIFILAFTFTASVDRTIVPVGHSFVVNVEVSGENLKGISEPTPPVSDKIEIVGKSSSHSTQIQMINGKFTKSTSLIYNYTVIALKEGEITIPPFTVEHDGKEYSTDPVKIKVTESEEEKHAIPERKERTRGVKDVFVECSISRENVYPGEGVLVSFNLYTRVNLSDVKLVTIPRYNNVWIEEISTPKKIDFRNKLRDGVSYSCALIKKDLIFPLKEGEVKIAPLEMYVELAGDIFSFFGESRRISSEEKIIKVKPLPEKRPKGFIDAVGDFEMNVELDTSNVEAGTPFPLRIKIIGSGNLRLLTAPELPRSRRMNIFRPESEEKTTVEGSMMKGEKIFSYLITPEESGFIEVPSFKWAFFSPKNEKFIEKTAGPYRIRVEPPSKKEESIKIKGEDITYIMPVDEDSYPIIPKLFFLYLLLPLTILAASGYYVYERKKLLKDIDYARIKSIPGELQKGFKNLKKEIEQERAELFYEELSRLLLKFFKLRYGLDAFSLRHGELIKELQKIKVSDEILSKIDSLLKRSESFRFAPRVPTKEEMVSDLELLKGLIRDLH
jgi:hypothetical protein